MKFPDNIGIQSKHSLLSSSSAKLFADGRAVAVVEHQSAGLAQFALQLDGLLPLLLHLCKKKKKK